jgi:signal transduction histidine kinase
MKTSNCTISNHTLLKYFLLLLLMQYAPVVFSQTKYIDSLRNNIATAKNDKQRSEAVFRLCDEANSLNPDTLNKYSGMGNMLALRLQNQQAIIQSQLYRAMLLSREGRFDAELNLIDSSLLALKNLNNPGLETRFGLLKTNVLIRLNKQKEAINYSLQILHYAEINKDKVTQVRAKTIIGWAYMEIGQNRDALNWLLAGDALQQTLPKNLWQPFLYSNIAAVYNEMKKNDSAEYYIKIALQESLEKNDLSYLANTYFIYAGISADLKRKKQAEAFLEKGLLVREKIGDAFYIVSDMYQMGLNYADYNEPQKGIAVLRQGIDMAYKNNLVEKLPILYNALARNYKTAGNYVAYGKTMDTIVMLKDSIYKNNSAEAIAEMQTKYEVQKKENTIIQQHYDLAKKNMFIYSIGGVFAITVISGFFFFQNRKKNQRLKIQAVEMEQKKKLAQAVMQAEEEERQRIAADLHDSVAQKMVVAKFNLEAFGNGMEIPEQKQTIYNNIHSLLKETAGEVRNLSHSMMPYAFARHGLAHSIKDFLDKIHKKDCKINFNATGDFSHIPENIALMIYRIMQESIQNALKHSGATVIDVSMHCANNEADIIIEDNGKGFNINEINKGTGLKNIQSRVEFLNGKTEINSIVGKGTVIAIFLPLYFQQ